ncbi:MAG: 2-hydroxyacyl-CoA dehydratase [Oscillospiraceae bacterium]|nr:2-hydroxyacyl-CoA dehydratase [Oscillospiraceae bacterium]
MSIQELFDTFHAAASNPAGQFQSCLDAGEQVVLCAPVYTPEEIIHSMGLVPFGAWGGDLALNKSKEYFPAFICSVMQSILELGIAGTYKGARAIVIPSLCDSLKCLGENWKYAVKDIPFIPMTYPQNRNNDVGRAFARAGYERVISDLEKATGASFSQEKLAESIKIYNAHNAAMRRFDAALCAHPEISASRRCDVFKSAWFMKKEEHTALVLQLLEELEAAGPGEARGTIPVMTSGILCDSPSLLRIFDEFGLRIVADDVAAESRQYRTDAPETGDALDALAEKFARMDHCSVLYDVEKKRASLIVDTAKARGAKGVVLMLTKFCDPEEFDFPILKKACAAADLPLTLIEVDRQMVNYEQARTLLEAFRDVL